MAAGTVYPSGTSKPQFWLISVKYTGAVNFFLAFKIVLYTRIMHIKFGFLTQRFVGVNGLTDFWMGIFD